MKRPQRQLKILQLPEHEDCLSGRTSLLPYRVDPGRSEPQHLFWSVVTGWVMALRNSPRRRITRVVGSIFVSTCLLTLDFLGVLALADTGFGGIGSRFPFYLLTGAIVFVGSLFYLESRFTTGRRVIIATSGFALLSFVVVSLAVEGLIFSITTPSKVLTESLLVYFLSAGLICTGLGFWTLNHWREFIGSRPRA